MGERRGRGGGRRRGGEERGRRDHQRVVAGLHPVRELLRAGGEVRVVRVAEGRDESDVLDDVLDLARRAGVPVETVERRRLDDQAGTPTHQGVVAVAPPFPYAALPDVLDGADRDDRPALLVALDGVTDPHNVGSIARTAEAVGAHGMLLPARRAASVTSTVEKAAAGALAHLPVVQGNLAQLLGRSREHGCWIVGLDATGEVEADDCGLLAEPVVLVVGAEGDGLARLTAERCDQLVRLPMRGRVGSLNASVAAAVALYAAERARR